MQCENESNACYLGIIVNPSEWALSSNPINELKTSHRRKKESPRLIDVAQRRPSHSVQRGSDGDVAVQRLKGHGVSELGLGSRGLVVHGVGAGDGLPVRPIEVLPDEVHAVDVAVVQVEARLERREVEVAAGIAADDIVATGVDADAGLDSLGIAAVCLDDGLEDLDRLAVEDGVGRVAEGGSLAADVRVEVPLDAPRVVGERVQRADGPDVDGEVCEWLARLETSTAGAGLEPTELRSVVGHVRAVPAERILRSVKEGRLVGAGIAV